MEMWDIYDRNKNLTGKTMRKNDWILQDGEYHLTVLGIVKNKKTGKYLITQRVMTKAWAPGWWEVSGGACQAGETSLEAVRREVREETGLNTDNAGTFLFDYHRENPGEGDNYFVDIYLFELDFEPSDVSIQKEEANDYKLATLDEIKALAGEGIFLHYDSIKEAFR